MKINTSLISKDMKRALLFFAALGILVLVIVFVYPLYKQQKDKLIARNLESKIIPFLVQNKISYFSDEPKCKQIRHGLVQAASPKGCAYIENVTDASKKEIPDFNNGDKFLFEKTKEVLASAGPEKIFMIGTEYTRYDDPQAPQPPQNIGTALYVECFWCRTRYVYWPDYKSLPRSWQGDIIYTPINKDWYRVNED